MPRSDIQRRGGPQVLSLWQRFGLRRVPPAMELLQQVVPTARVPRLDLLCGGVGSIAVLAANKSMVQLFNPVGSGIIVILHRIWVRIGTADQEMRFNVHDVALADSVSTLRVLNRGPSTAQIEPSAILRSLRGTLVGDQAMQFGLDIADRTYEVDFTRLGDDQELPGPSLTEGRGFLTSPAADNMSNTTVWLWSERIAE